MSQSFSVPRGTTDILPSEITRWQKLEAKAREVFTRFGYSEIRTPFFEETALFARSMGQTSDIVEKQMLNVTNQRSDKISDDKKDGLALRPEGTASIARSYIENRLDTQEMLSKLFYIGPMFRGERPQKGRLRQFHQVGCEAIGPNSSSPFLDAEVIALAVALLKEAGLAEKSFLLKINSLGSPEDKKNFSKFLRDRLLTQVKKLCAECQNRFERNVFRILDCKNKDCKAIVGSLNIDDSYLSDTSRQHFLKVKEALDALKIAFEVDFKLVRGLDYYTHTVFEISSSALGSQDALGAGGRYNNLVEDLGGPKVDAVGFALGMERILLALGEQSTENQSALDVFVVALGEAAFKKAYQLLFDLRAAGVSAVMDFKEASMKSQMRQANKLGAKKVLIIGDDELNSGELTLKDMATGEQIKVEEGKVVESFRKKVEFRL